MALAVALLAAALAWRPAPAQPLASRPARAMALARRAAPPPQALGRARAAPRALGRQHATPQARLSAAAPAELLRAAGGARSQATVGGGYSCRQLGNAGAILLPYQPVRIQMQLLPAVVEQQSNNLGSADRSSHVTARFLAFLRAFPRMLTTFLVSCCFSLAIPRLLLAGTGGSRIPASPLGLVLRYGTIPVVAGLLNMATNKLAVKMMFYPLRFVGIGPVGWQGIVPGKTVEMANKIVDDVMLRLIDVREVFYRLTPERIAAALDPMLLRIGNELATELLRDRATNLAPLATPIVGTQLFNDTLLDQGRALVVEVVRDVQARAPEVFSLRHLVTSGFQADAGRLVRLFERCGDKDLRFVVTSGLWLGGALGVLQALLFYYWNPWWSLAATGAMVGMITDQLALKLIFEPVEPKMIGPLRIQGLFLKRQVPRGRVRFRNLEDLQLPLCSPHSQDEVSEMFAEFMEAEVASPGLLWKEILSGENSQAFWELDRSQLSFLVGAKNWAWLTNELMDRLKRELPKDVYLVYEITREELDLQPLMTTKMQALTSAEFERVLHPVFEEDELTLILIGTALGGIAGAVQGNL